VSQSSNIFELLQNDDDESDTEAGNGQNEVSEADSDVESDEDEMETTAVKAGDMHKWTAKRIAKHHGVSLKQLAEYNGDENGNVFIASAAKFNADYTLNFLLCGHRSSGGVHVWSSWKLKTCEICPRCTYGCVNIAISCVAKVTCLYI
jgi:hypothetical protein